MALPERAVARPLQVRRGTVDAALAAMRPRQWSKNLLLLGGLVFAAKLGDPVRWLDALTALTAYCAASSAAYLVNDVLDAPDDRLHPVKRFRPVARGELTPPAALALAAALICSGLLLAAALGPASFGLLMAFGALQLAYSLGLKRLVLVDVLAIGSLFVVRAGAGAVAIDVAISPWLLCCTGLLALFLALAKRRCELVLVGAERTPGRPVLAGYSLVLVDRLVCVVAAATVAVYALYTLTAHSPAMTATIPFVVFGVFRYLLLVHGRALGEEPENVLLSDKPLLAAVGVWAATAAGILTLGGI